MGRKRTVRKRKKKTAVLVLLVLFFAVTCAAATELKKTVEPNLEEIGRMRAKVMVNQIVNKAINDQLLKEDSDMHELLVRKTDEGGGTEVLEANTKAMNIFVTEVSKELQEEYAARSEDEYCVPAGALIGDGIMSQAGPDIKLRIKPLSVGSIDFKTEFESRGINQTKYKVYIELVSDVKVLSPFASEHLEVATTVLVAEAVILGGVPGSYVYVPEEDILDITQE